jgi:hypothetical protein
MGEAAVERITADWPVREVIVRFPTTGPVFLQYGPMFRVAEGHLYASYEPPLTVAEFAALNRAPVERLLALLNAAAEAERLGETSSYPATGRLPEEGGRLPPAPGLGYTGGYGQRDDVPVDAVPLVTVLEQRGPE